MPRFMSRFFGLALLFALVISPMMSRGAIAQDATPCPAMTQEDAVAWATAYYTARNTNDAAQLAAFYAPDAIHHWGIGVDQEGSEAITGALEAFFTAFPSSHVTVDQVWLAGDTIIIRWIAIGIQEGDFMGVPGSLDTVTWTGINIMKVDCGLIVESWAEADHFGRLEQMGIIPIAPDAEATPAA